MDTLMNQLFFVIVGAWVTTSRPVSAGPRPSQMQPAANLLPDRRWIESLSRSMKADDPRFSNGRGLRCVRTWFHMAYQLAAAPSSR